MFPEARDAQLENVYDNLGPLLIDQKVSLVTGPLYRQPRRTSFRYRQFPQPRLFAPHFVRLQRSFSLNPRLVVRTHQQQDRDHDRAHVVIHTVFGKDLFAINKVNDDQPCVEQVQKEADRNRDIGAAQAV
jgi:hypothetical protein